MFGCLTVQRRPGLSGAERAALRLRPAKGLRRGGGLYRTSLFRWTEVTLPEEWRPALAERRVLAALEALRAEGVCRTAAPPEWRGAVLRAGLLPLEENSALEACAAQAVDEGCRALGLPPEEAGLAVCGRGISGPVQDQVLALGRRMRTVRVWGGENRELRARLWRDCGIVDRGPMPQGTPVIVLLLREGTPPPEAALVIDLSENGAETLPQEAWRPDLLPPPGALKLLPPGLTPRSFAAALLDAGAIQAREIRVSRLDIGKRAQYNKETGNNC